MDALEKFRNTLQTHFSFHESDVILIAVSGGVDSVVLMDLFSRVKRENDFTLRLIHLNHGIRGEESDQDQTFVEGLADDYGLELSIGRVEALNYADESKRSLEEAARILRYRFFEKELVKEDAAYVALGHHADDQAETILDHFLRGSGIRGLGGMKRIRGRYIRPLLSFSRQQIEAYAREFNLLFRTDLSNRDLKYKRNRIRHELIPMLEENFNPSIRKTIFNLGEIMEQNQAFMASEADKAFAACLKLSQKKKIILEFNQFLEYFDIIKIYILFKIQELLNIDKAVLSFDRLSTFLNFLKDAKHGKIFELSKDWLVLIDHDGLVFQESVLERFEFKVIPDIEYSVFDGEKVFIVSRIDRSRLPEYYMKASGVEYIDADAIDGSLALRNHQPGDSFTPLNMKGRKKVSDFYTDNKVPLHLRNCIPILVCDIGIICITGYQIDDRYKIVENSKNILKLELKDVEPNG